jgi:hypothetical protein
MHSLISIGIEHWQHELVSQTLRCVNIWISYGSALLPSTHIKKCDESNPHISLVQLLYITVINVLPFDSSVGVVTRLRAERSGVPFLVGASDLSVLVNAPTDCGFTQPPVRWVLGLKRPVREVDHWKSRLNGAVVASGDLITPSDHLISILL